MEWARTAASLGIATADRMYPVRVVAGNEGFVVERRARALGFVKHRALEEWSKRREAERRSRVPDGR